MKFLEGDIKVVLRLTIDQIKTFDNDGYLVLRKWIPADMVSQLRHATSEAITRQLHHFQAGSSNQHAAVITKGKKSFVTRINDLFLDHSLSFSELLGCPQILNVAKALSGDDCISTYESLLVKNEGDGQAINWHRDMEHNRSDRVITVGVYLDEARKDKGALRIIPKSQLSSKDICKFEDGWQQGYLEAVEIEMDPGDVLVHDVMAVHSSEPITKQEYRRTIYFEFRSKAQAQTNQGFTSEWIELRSQLLEIAHKRWKMNHEQLSDSDKWSKKERQLIEQLYRTKAQIEPGHYCFRHG